MKQWMRHGMGLGLRGKTTFALGLLLLLVLSISSAGSYWQSQAIAKQNALDLERKKLELLKREIEIELLVHRNNLLSMRDIPSIDAINRARLYGGIDPESGDSLSEWYDRLTVVFSAFLEHHPQYFQIRYVAADGNELVKVEKTADGRVIGAAKALNSQFEAGYVKKAITLKEGQTYYSDVTLNREQGVVQQPYVPVLRMATPVHTADNKVAGLVVINFLVEKLFAGINASEEGVERNVVDHQGDYIKHVDNSKTFGRFRGGGYGFHEADPALSKMAASSDQFLRYDQVNNELDGFQKIYFSPSDRSRYWLLTFHIPGELVSIPVDLQFKNRLYISLLVGFISLLLVVWYISRKILTPVADVAAAAKRLQEGDLGIRIDEHSVRDEFLTLYRAVNAFAENQQNATIRLENQVAKQTRKLSAVIDNVIDGIITISERGTIETFNPAARSIFGYTNEEVIGKNVKMLMPEPYHGEHDGYLDNYIRTGEKKIIGIGREVIGRRKNGEVFPMELAVGDVVIDSARHFVGIIRDITERKIFEQLIVDEKNQLAAVIDNVIDGIITISEKGVIETFNPAARRIFGFNDEEVLGKNVKMLMPEPYHGEHDSYLDNHIKTGEKKVIGIGREVLGRRKDGSIFPMELAVSDVVIDNVRHFVGITRDITERKRIEQMQKEFVSTVSHELRTPLTSIRGSLGLILGGVAGEVTEKTKELITIANNNSERLIHMINDILDAEKISAGKMQFDYRVVNLIPLIEQAVDSNAGYGEQLNVTFNFSVDSDDVVMVRVDEKRLAQVMSNLLSNAAKYSPANDHVDVSIKKWGEKVRIAVQDHGDGIPEEFLPRIFGKFAQADSSDTRQKGGTGLGLNITRAIVEQHNGDISFSSCKGEGTAFYVDLPLWDESRPFGRGSDERSDNGKNNDEENGDKSTGEDSAKTLLEVAVENHNE